MAVHGFGKNGFRVITDQKLVLEPRMGDPCQCGALIMNPTILGGPIILTVDGTAVVHRRDACIEREGYNGSVDGVPEPYTVEWNEWSGQ